VRGQSGDRRRDAGEAPCVVAAVAAHQAHARTVLVREHPPPVDLLFVDPAVAVERLAHLRRSHGRVVGQHRQSFYAASG